MIHEKQRSFECRRVSGINCVFASAEQRKIAVVGNHFETALLIEPVDQRRIRLQCDLGPVGKDRFHGSRMRQC
jgi:hypothetical protein